MLGARKHGRLLAGGGAIALCAVALALAPASVRASGAPQLGDSWSYSVLNDSARLGAEVNPNGLSTTYHFDYITDAAWEANLAAAKEGFSGAAKAPLVTDPNIGVGTSYLTVSQPLPGLTAATAYRYRVVAHNSGGTTNGSPHLFVTQPSPGPTLLDSRGWEMVSPVDKNGGQVDEPESIAGGGVLQAAAGREEVTYSSTASFAGAQGAPPASQYLATRTSTGWSTQNLTVPIFSGTYDAEEGGVPYRLFSSDLARALLLNGDHCRGEGSDCAVTNPPLAGTSAPEGYQDYYLREGSSFAALLGAANSGFLSLDPARFDLSLAGATPDLAHVVLSSCAKLTPDAVEVPLGEGCDPAKQNLYEWSGAGLTLVNLLPAQSSGTPGAQSGAISEDGSRVYFSDEGNLYLREGSQTKLVAGAGEFQTAAADGAIAYYTKPDEHLWRYVAAGAGTSTDLTPSGGVAGVLGASASGDTAYYQDGSGVKRWHTGTTNSVAAGGEAAAVSDWPPAAGTSRVSSDGTKLLFLSTEALTGYDNTDLATGEPDSEVFLYDSTSTPALHCVSCNPTGERPLGPATIPGAIRNGSAPGSTRLYRPRVLSTDGRRVFFDSADALVLTDGNVDHTTGAGIADAYEWEAQGEGSCARAGGCVALVSSGRDPAGGTFLDASADGADAFFLTNASLVHADPGSVDLYDARVDGGFAEPSPPLACEGDACQPLPSQPVDPTLDTLLSGPGNPPVRYPGVKCRKGFLKRKGECVSKKPKKHGHRKHKRHRKRRRGAGR